MKFQDDISNMNTYIRTYIRTSRNQYAPPLFQSWGHNHSYVIRVKQRQFHSKVIPSINRGLTMNARNNIPYIRKLCVCLTQTDRLITDYI